MSSELEKAMMTIVQIFHKYSRHKCKLKKADLKDLINNEMSQFIKVSVWDQTCDGAMNLSNGCEKSDSPIIQISEIFPYVGYGRRFLLSNYASNVWHTGADTQLSQESQVQWHTLNGMFV